MGTVPYPFLGTTISRTDPVNRVPSRLPAGAGVGTVGRLLPGGSPPPRAFDIFSPAVGECGSMSRINVAVIVGSLRKGSYNRQLANALPALAPPGFTFRLVRIGDLPLYDQDDDDNQAGPVKRMKAEIAGADALLFVIPEYNRSVPAVLKNAIDHGSRPPGQNVWAGKPAGVLGVSPGAAGTAMAQQHLRNILAFLDVPTQGQPEAYLQLRVGMFNESGGLGEARRPFLRVWMDGYVAWVSKGMVLRDHETKIGAG